MTIRFAAILLSILCLQILGCSDSSGNSDTDTSSSDSEGGWYSFWDDTKYDGNSTENISTSTGDIPVFVKEGGILPMAPFAKSTFFIDDEQLAIHVYTGADGSFQLYEDDGVTAKFRTRGESRLTEIQFTQDDLGLEVSAAAGTYDGAPSSRSYEIIYHGLSAQTSMYLDGEAVNASWDGQNRLMTVTVPARSVSSGFKVSNATK